MSGVNLRFDIEEDVGPEEEEASEDGDEVVVSWAAEAVSC